MSSELWYERILADIDSNAEVWGGKAVALHKAQTFGIYTPPCIVIPSFLHNDYIARGGFIEDEWDSLRSILRDYFLPYQSLMVRSSANIENTARYASCGLFESYKTDSILSVPNAIERVWDSLNNQGTENYLKLISQSKDSVNIAIIIQEFFEGIIGGVIHTRDQIGNTENVYVEYVVGKGMNAVVDGIDNAELAIFNRDGKLCSGEYLPAPYSSFLKEIVLESIRLERCFQSGLEIEFQINDKQSSILQVREVDSL